MSPMVTTGVPVGLGADAVLDATSPVRTILQRALDGAFVSEADGVRLFRTRGDDKRAVLAAADILRQRVHGEQVSFVVNRNINFTNICYMGCRFCGFARRREDADAEWLPLDRIVARAEEAWARGATEVCLQGGLHPDMPGTVYRDIICALKAALPDLHIHAFSPFEIWYGSHKRRMSYRDFLADLQACGLGSMPGTAAEILDRDVRRQLTRNKLSATQWITIIRTAHSLGIPTSATIMYGHVDAPEHWAAHLALLRTIQAETGMFTELVPLSFVHADSPLYRDNPTGVRPGPTVDEVDLMHAVGRIMLHGTIDNIQVSWTKLGADRACRMLAHGVNDLGGTLMNESISRAAGSRHGQEITAREFCHLIRSVGRIPVQRNTVYGIIDVYDGHDPEALAPLVTREAHDPLAFLAMPAMPA